jgi:quinol---cytochrome-c reductase cytochrome b subunit
MTDRTRAPLKWVDERLGTAGFARTAFRKVFPDHWSFLLGEVALFSLIILVASGTFLTLFYTPSTAEVVYDGPYDPLRGQEVSAAFNSVMRLSFEVRAGLLMRQLHHWAALVFVASIVVHLCRVFFTGAFRRPRELNYVIGMVLLLLGLAEGFTGYSLPDDLLSGIGLRIAYSVSLAIPVVGTWLTYLVFGGEFPTSDIISRLFVFHVMLLPAILLAGVAAHMVILVLQKHTQFRGPRRREHNVVGKRLWPEQTFKSTALFLIIAAVIAALGGLAQINPIWEYGPYNPFSVTAPAQPDWYIGWLDGALRLAGPWDISLPGGFVVSELFWPAVLFPGIAIGIITLWPFIEPRFTKDRAEHHLLDRPRDVPFRTAAGVAGLTVFFILFLEGGNDVVGILLNVPVEVITRGLQISFVVAPVIAFYLTWRICKNLQKTEAHPAEPAAGFRLRRNRRGGYETAPLAPPSPNGEAATSGEAAEAPRPAGH